MPEPTTVDEYMATLGEERRAWMEELRSTIKAAAPRATEVISYKMPAFKLGKRFLVSYDAFKKHYSMFPWTEEMREAIGNELEPYLHGRGTIRFPADKPVPVSLVTRIIKFRLAEEDARVARETG